MDTVTSSVQLVPNSQSTTRRLLHSALLILIVQGGFLYWLGSERGINPEQAGKLIGELLAAMFFALLIAAFFTRKKSWSYVTSFIVLFLLSTILFISFISSKLGENANKSAENAKIHERQLQSMNALLDKYAVLFESINDDASAKRTLAQLPPLFAQAQVIVNEAKKIPNISKRDSDALQKRYEPQMIQIQERLKVAVEKIDKLNIDTRSLGEEMLKVYNLFMQLANKP